MAFRRERCGCTASNDARGLDIAKALVSRNKISELTFKVSCMDTKLQMFHQAAYHGKVEVVNDMLQAGLDINAPSDQFENLLVAACSGTSLELPKFLLQGKWLWTNNSFDQRLTVPRIYVTRGAIQAALHHKTHSAELTRIVLTSEAEQTPLRYDDVKDLARSGDSETMCTLLTLRHSEVEITQAVLRNAIENAKHGLQMTKLLLDECANALTIDDLTLQSAAHVSNDQLLDLVVHRVQLNSVKSFLSSVPAHSGSKLIVRLIEKFGQSMLTTSKTILLAAIHDSALLDVMIECGDLDSIPDPFAYCLTDPVAARVILQKTTIDVEFTRQNLNRIVRDCDNGLMMLLAQREDVQRCADTALLSAALSNQAHKTEIIHTLLNMINTNLDLTQQALEGLLTDLRTNSSVASLLLSHFETPKKLDLRKCLTALLRSDVLRVDIISVVLKHEASQPLLTNSIWIDTLSLENDRGKEIFQLFLDVRPNEIHFGEVIFKIAAQHGLSWAFDMMLAAGKKLPPISQEMLQIAIAGLGWIKSSQMLGLFSVPRDDLELVLIAAINTGTVQIVRQLLERRSHEIIVTEDVIVAAAASPQSVTVTSYLIDFVWDFEHISDEAIGVVIICCNTDVANFVLDQIHQRPSLLEVVLVSAVQNDQFGPRILETILEEFESDVPITSQILERLFRCGTSEMLEVIMDNVDLYDFEADNILYQNISNNEKHGAELAKFLVINYNAWLNPTDMMINKVAATRAGVDVLDHFVGGRACRAQPVFLSMIRNGSGFDALLAFLEKYHRDIKIVRETILLAMEKNSSIQVIRLLLARCAVWNRVDTDVLCAAADMDSLDTFEFLLTQCRGEVWVTEQVLISAIETKNEALRKLRALARHATLVPLVTPSVLMAIVQQDGFIAEAMLELLLDQPGLTLFFTAEMLIATFKSDKLHDDINPRLLNLLLDQRSPRIEMTEGVLMAAVRSKNCKTIFTILSERRGSSSIITQAVLDAAATNSCTSDDLGVLFGRL